MDQTTGSRAKSETEDDDWEEIRRRHRERPTSGCVASPLAAAFIRVELDPQLWLTWGMGEEVPALAFNGDALVARPPVQVPARFADIERLHLGGLLWPEAAGRLARTAYATREELGHGQVILFRDSPAFRGWTRGTRRLLVNAMLYGPGLGTRWSTPW